MKVEGLVFNVLGAFFGLMAVVYGFVTHFDEQVGFYGLVLVTGMAFMVGLYVVATGRRIDPRPEDNPDGEIAELAGEQGHFSPWSWWPLPLALAGAFVFLGIAVAWWLCIVGVGLGIVAVAGWTFEYYTGEAAH